jgi:hypothetical protein
MHRMGCGIQVLLLILIILVSSAIIQGRTTSDTTGGDTGRDRQNDFTQASRQKCAGRTNSIRLNQGQSIELESPGGMNGNFQPSCKESWEVAMIKDDQEVGQWRIKVEILEMNLPCASSGFRIIEDSSPRINNHHCNEKSSNNSDKVFFSHEHLLNLKFSTEDICQEASGCRNIGIKVRVSADYVCGGKFTSNSGTIVSPFYPLTYPHSTSCIYDISAPEHSQVELTCEYFNLSPYCDTRRCNPGAGDRDFIQDIMGQTRYEGGDLEGRTITSRRQHLTLYFLSNSHKISPEDGGYGFSCSYKFINSDQN